MDNGFESRRHIEESAAVGASIVQQTDLFIGGQDGANIYRIPSLLAAPSGAILAFAEARDGDDGDPTDLVLKRSVYEMPAPRMLNGYQRTFGFGFTWERQRTVLSGEGDAIMNPTPVVDRERATIVLPCYKALGGLKHHCENPYEGPVYLLFSADEGASWSKPRDIKSSIGEFTPGPGVGIQLRNGRLVIPGYGPAKGGG